jgi:hypothetical protein
LDGIIKTNKNGFLVTLPSVTLDKEFLYRVQWPKHSAKKAHLETDKASLSSVVPLLLGKEASFVDCLLVHSAKELTKGSAGDPFAEWYLIHSTKELANEPMGASLTSVSTVDTRQRVRFCRVLPWHLTKSSSPSPGTVTVAFLCRVPSGTR